MNIVTSFNLDKPDNPIKKFNYAKQVKGVDLKKEITKFNCKVESKKKTSRKIHDLLDGDENDVRFLKTNFYNLSPEENKYTMESRFIKNKVLIIKPNTRKSLEDRLFTYGGLPKFAHKLMASSQNRGTLYKTHTLRRRLISNEHIELPKEKNRPYRNKLQDIDLNCMNENRTQSVEESLMKNNLSNLDFGASSHSTDRQEINNAYANSEDQTVNNLDNHIKFEKKINSLYPANSNNESQFPETHDFENGINNFRNTSTTIYKILNVKKNDFIKGIKTGSLNKICPENQTKMKKKKFMMRNTLTHFMEKKGDEVPYVFPVALSHNNDFNSFSEKNRYEKILDKLLKLKYYIDRDPDNEPLYIKEFMMKHGIFEQEFYDCEKISNVVAFLNSKLIVDPSKTLKQIILEATKFNSKSKHEKEIKHIGYNSFKGKHIIQYKLNKKNKVVKKENKEENRFNMNNYLSQHQPILEDKLFKLDKNNNKKIINNLEDEFALLEQGIGGLNFNLGETIIQENKKAESNTKSIRHSRDLSLTEKNPKASHSTSSNFLKSSPKKKVELDLENIKKKNKLLEYIVLQRSKSNLQLEEDMKKFKISNI